MIEDFGEVISANSNCNGTKVALIIALDTMIPDTKIYVIDLETDQIQWIDLSNGETLVREDHQFTQ